MYTPPFTFSCSASDPFTFRGTATRNPNRLDIHSNPVATCKSICFEDPVLLYAEWDFYVDVSLPVHGNWNALYDIGGISLSGTLVHHRNASAEGGNGAAVTQNPHYGEHQPAVVEADKRARRRAAGPLARGPT